MRCVADLESSHACSLAVSDSCDVMTGMGSPAALLLTFLQTVCRLAEQQPSTFAIRRASRA